jgi:hypothetical protein
MRGRAFVVACAFTLAVALAAPLPEGRALAGPANGTDDDVDAGQGHDAAPSTPCAADMVEVKGDYCPDLDQRCLQWIPSQVGAERCALFAPSSSCKQPVVKKHFCIDRYEYPNKQGSVPSTMKTWMEGQETCRSIGKRLCGDTEWTLACEGRRRLPYPYGLKRDSRACNIDKALLEVNPFALADPKRAAAETARLWQGEPSGSRPGCASPFGVVDMTGNVDEWVVNESGKPFRSGLKGGYWGPVRARCRPMTTGHGETFPF